MLSARDGIAESEHRAGRLANVWNLRARRNPGLVRRIQYGCSIFASHRVRVRTQCPRPTKSN